MPYSPESLQAFVEAAALGSFSAAARRLRKTQSTVSTAIAHLEADLGVSLFDRSGRYPQLTEAGRQVLGHAQEILAADARLQQLSVRLAAPVESRLTVVFSDVYQLDPEQRILQRFAEAFPEIELEWLDAEGRTCWNWSAVVAPGWACCPGRSAIPMDWWRDRWPTTANCRCTWRATIRWPAPGVAPPHNWHGIGRCA